MVLRPSQQDINLGEDGAAGGTGSNADTVVGITAAALLADNPQGHGGPGGGGAGGGIFLMGREGVLIGPSAVLSAQGGTGGRSADPDMKGGDGSPGIITLAAPRECWSTSSRRRPSRRRRTQSSTCPPWTSPP